MDPAGAGQATTLNPQGDGTGAMGGGVPKGKGGTVGVAGEGPLT